MPLKTFPALFCMKLSNCCIDSALLNTEDPVPFHLSPLFESFSRSFIPSLSHSNSSATLVQSGSREYACTVRVSGERRVYLYNLYKSICSVAFPRPTAARRLPAEVPLVITECVCMTDRSRSNSERFTPAGEELSSRGKYKVAR